LKSLNVREELAVFLSTRGLCLMEAGRRAEAAESFAHAVRLAPDVASYKSMTAQLQASSRTRNSVVVQ
jgi:Tfp pilus assembly protein PilF